MQYVDFNDQRIPIGKRKVAFIKWAVHNGTPLERAQRIANRKFGFERKGKYIVRVGNAGDIDLPSMRRVSWADIVGLDPRRCESIIVLPSDTYAPFELCNGSILSEKQAKEYARRFIERDPYPEWENAEAWAKRNGYILKTTYITP